MPHPLKVLIVEDNPADADLVLRELRRAGFEPDWQCVDTEAAYLERLSEGFDLVLSDYAMPQFSGPRALELLKERKLDVPFILISGTIGEDAAVAAMKLGASDYLLKDRLGRLGPAVTHALDQSRLRHDRDAAQAALQESEERFRQMAATIDEVFWMADVTNGQIVYVSPAYERLWGRTCASLLENPRSFIESIHAEDRERVLAGLALQQEGRPFDHEYRILRPDGEVRHVWDRGYPVQAMGGGVTHYVGVAQDITERKKLQEQFLRSQRMEAIGTLAGGVAHDLNNILAPIVMGAGMLRERITAPQDQELMKMIETAAGRGTSVIRQLLTFSRGIAGDRVSVQLRHLIGEMAGIIRQTFPRDISLHENMSRDLRVVVADPTQLHQVIMNLCVNARDAMPNGGKLTLAARNVELGAADVEPHAPARPGPYVAVSVTDTGHGIPPEILGRIFDPFFTTKPPTKGTGLGLSTVLGLVRSHGGLITVASTPRGTTFTVCLPAAVDAASVTVAPAANALPGGNGELILLVDDEEPIRRATRLMLEAHGYRVLTASNGAEAVAMFVENRDAVRLVLTDVMMPVMGGINLTHALRAIEPKLTVLASSGLTDQASHAELTAVGVNGIVAKPYGPRELLEAIHAQLKPSGPN